VIFIGVILFQFADNEAALNTKTYTYSMTILLPLLFVSIYFMRANRTYSKKTSIMMLGVVTGFFAFVYIAYYFYSKMSSEYYYIFNYILNVLIFLIIMVGLSIFYRVFINNLYRSDSEWAFAISLLFYIPCLISDFIKYMFGQFKITTPFVFVLLAIEMLFILLYIFLPMLFKKWNKTKSNLVLLQNEPVFLDSQTQIGSAEMKNINKNPKQDLLEYGYSANYSISMWIFINPQNMSNGAYSKETEIFSYGNGNDVKPCVTYLYDNDGLDIYKVYCSNKTTPIQFTVTSQKWNQFVFNYNYNDSAVDIFINGHLERSVSFNETSVPKYDPSDTIMVGAENGIEGAICNVTYSSIPLTKKQIANSYNLLMNKNPPMASKS
jgi:hypothetical protein